MTGSLRALRWTRGALRRLDTILTRATAPMIDTGSTAPSGDALAEAEDFFRELASDSTSRPYIEAHWHRLIRTIALAPRAAGSKRALELGAYMQMTPALSVVSGYTEVAAAAFGPAGESVRQTARVGSRSLTYDVSLFDAEQDPFPYPTGYFSLVLCCEMVEHLLRDPMHMLLEIRRVLEPAGHVLLTTPNCASLTSLACVLHGRRNPQVYACYSRANPDDRPHVREYTAYEMGELVKAAGFEVEHLFTERIQGSDEANWVRDILIGNNLEASLRGEQTYCLARVSSALPIDRYPPWLYA